MRLTYLDRATYRAKNDPVVIERLREQFGDFYLIPEGGSNALALPGCAELVAGIEDDFDVVCCACGTGGTLSGIAAGLDEGKTAIGFSALRGGDFLRRDVAELQRAAYGAPTDNWEIELGYHFGVFDLIAAGRFTPGTTIVAALTGPAFDA